MATSCKHRQPVNKPINNLCSLTYLNLLHTRNYKRAAEQVIGREGETATFFSRCVLNFGGLGGGFAPRHLNRSAASAYTRSA